MSLNAADREAERAPLPPLSIVVRRTNDVACWAGGPIAVVMLAAGLLSTEGTLGDWTVIGLTLALWLFALSRRGVLRAVLVIGSIGLAPLLAMTHLLVSTSAWIPVPQLAFGAVVTAIFTLPLAGAIVTVLLAVVVEFALVLQSRIIGDDSGSFGDAANSLGYLMVVGIGYAIAVQAWRAYATKQDALHDAMHAEWEQTNREREFAESRFFVQRRIHETVLNTLSGIASGVRVDRTDYARAAAKSDLLQIDLGAEQLEDCRFAHVLDAAMEYLADADVRIRLDPGDDPVVMGATATVLRDAIVEALRNVVRHSGVREAEIAARVRGESFVVSIRDRGIGIHAGVRERFGVRQTIRGGLSSIGGEGTVDAAEGGGTVVTLRVPLTSPVVLPDLTVRPIGMFDDSAAARFGTCATVLYLLISGWGLATFFSAPGLVIAFTLLCELASILLCLLWNSRWRPVLALLVVASSVSVYCVAVATVQGCASQPGVLGLMICVSGGVLLPMFAAPSVRPRIAVALIMCAALLIPYVGLPAECRGTLALPIAFHVMYVALLVLVSTWLIDVYAPGMERALAASMRASAVNGARLRRVHIANEWMRQGGSARRILEEISNGELDLQDPAVQARAEAEAQGLRARLSAEVEIADDSGLRAALRTLVRTADSVNALLDVADLSEAERPDRLPADLLAVVTSVVEHCGGRSIGARTLVDASLEELVVLVPVECARAADVMDGFKTSGDATLVMVTERHPIPGEPVRFTLSIRRPAVPQR